jgi:hypothetical protein
MKGLHPLSNLMRRPLLFVMALLLSACRLTPAPEPEPVAARGFSLVIPIYNEAGLSAALTTLKPHLRRDDRFLIVSGNTDGQIDPAWINRAALELRETYPHAPIYAATSGLSNVAQAAQSVIDTVEAIVYIYEPNFPNQPEFSWDFGTTLARFSQAGAQIRSGGFRAVGKPTGRPLLQPSLQAYAWDYGELAATVDELFIQTQTYCKESPAAFARAIDEIVEQYGAQAEALSWLPQVTIDPGAPNGTSVRQAQACLAEAQARGVSGAVLWWAPPFAGRAVSFIAALNRAEARQF